MTAKLKSTMAQKVDRMYRRQISVDQQLGNIEATMRLNHETDRATIKTLFDHVLRITREKETLVKLIGWPEVERRLAAANAFLANPLDRSAPAHPGPELADAVPMIADPAPASAVPHVYNEAGTRCLRCSFLKVAIEASGTLCEIE